MKEFESTALKLIKNAKDKFYIRDIKLVHSQEKKFDVWYCKYILYIETKNEQGVQLFKQQFETNLNKLFWFASWHTIRRVNNSNSVKDVRNLSDFYTNDCKICTNTKKQDKQNLLLLKEALHNPQAVLLFALISIYTAIFYIGLFNGSLIGNTILFIILMTMSTDGVMLFSSLFRSEKKNGHEDVTFDPSLVTCVIACHNGADVIGETLRQVMYHLSKKQILVISDKSTDNTVEVVKSMGVKVIDNKVNLNKALSISKAVPHIKTPLVLIMDDDVYIKDVFIPTSLITKDGYRAVAFNVIPKKPAL